jgi:hypothetical protein
MDPPEDPLVRVWLFLLSLVAALTGTPLRQAEAAHDFACAIADRLGGDDIKEIDGGVGDDYETAVHRAPSGARWILSVGEALPAPLIPRPILRDAFPDLPGDAIGDSPPPRARRLALLQSFLF